MRLNKKAIIVATCAACTLGLAAGCAPQQPSEIVRRHTLDRREESPLIRIRLKHSIDEH